MTLQIAVLASGTGSNVSAILDASEEGRLDARVRIILSNKSDAPVLEKARKRDIPVWSRSHRDFVSREEFDKAMLTVIRNAGADTVVLAGYTLLLSSMFIQAFPGRILNIHPSLLPSFPGVRGGGDALAYGARITGVTVHFVDEVMDNGPVIIQAAAPINSSDTLENLMPRIHSLEYRIYPQALQWLAQDRLRISGRRVTLLPDKRPHASSASQGQSLLGPWLVSPSLETF
ncbi:MAG: phosphoribosylglycinamide formyltransferase [Desulfovibrio sp.]|jgi:phosphoribosylglycinamide formyltransferase-1|nr:phosphoribosylglycinamide formyltransferase [Desulfovibrio sp.]